MAKSLGLPLSALFGTDGIRGKVGELLTPGLAREVGFWTGQILQQASTNTGPVLIGQDSRNSSQMLAEAIALGLNASGIEAWQLGLCPTPCVAYLTRKNNAMGGIMVSASHNPPGDNGIKIFGHKGTKLSPDLTRQIENGIRGLNIPPVSSKYLGRQFEHHALREDYLQGVLASLPQDTDFHGLLIVLDLAWGAAVELAPQAFRALGAEVICINSEANGDRINVECGSTHLEQLQAAIQTYQGDLGFAFDGDADRVIAVDARGNVVDGDHILYFWGKYLQQRQNLPKNLIIATVMANLGFEQAWCQTGGELIRTSVGDQYVQAQMWESGAMLGGEQSGHILCHHHSYSGDGLQTALHLTALTQQWGTSLTELRAASFQTYPQFLRNLRFKNREVLAQWQDCEEIQQAIAQAECALSTSGRILVRASGTEPLLRVMVEASDYQLASYWTDYLVTVVEQYLINA
nr:phosphoglucosamine mutase [Gloeocapsa sp. PCC 73106]